MNYSYFTQSNRHVLSFLLGVIILTIAPGNAAVRCELVRDSCLDLSKIAEQTITVPSNITRIDKSGLSLCLPYLTSYKAVDLVFIIDQSGSMVDTDPEKLVSPASLAALNLIDSLSPQSNVGFMGFSNGVCDGKQKNIEKKKGAGKKYEEKKSTLVFPKMLDNPVHKDSLLDPMTFSPDNFLTDCGSLSSNGYGTNYYRPFLLAEEWFDQMDSPNKQIIIFLTDGGNNTEKGEYQEMLERVDSTNFPIVHAIFVNRGKNPDLELMTEKTKGTYAQVEDFTNVKEVMMTMVGASLIPNSPELTTISKNGIVLLQTADHLHIELTNFQTTLSNDIALDTEANPFSVSVKTSDFGIKDKSFIIQVSGPPETATGKKDLGNGVFDAMCYDASTITNTDKSYTTPIQQLGAYHETGFGIVLNTPADDIDAVVDVQGVGDAERVKLPDTTAGYRGLAVFSNTAKKTPNNTIVEGLVGETLLFSWVHPYDPRDTASAMLPIYDNRADTTIVYFTDLQGKVITALNDLAGNQFKVVVFDNKATGSLAIQLASSHGDVLSVVAQQTGPKTFVAVVPFGFVSAVNPANQVIEGVFNPASASNQTTVTAKAKKIQSSLLLQKIYVPVEKTWILDNNGDGHADRIFIQYIEKIHSLPANVSDIHWPTGVSETKRAPAADATPDINPLSFSGNDSSLVLIDLSQDPFVFGATGASAALPPPTLLLPDGQKPVIQDSVKPILAAVEKKPSDFGRYMRKSDSAIITYPDTFIVTLSEAITPIPNAVAPWTSLLLVEKGDSLQAVNILSEPVVISADGRTLQVVFENPPGANTIKVDDYILLNINAQYLDNNNNGMSGLKTPISGRDGVIREFASSWRGGPISGEQKEQTFFSGSLQIPIIDEATKQVVGQISTSEVQEWVLPVGIGPSGNINLAAQTGNSCQDPQTLLSRFPSECLASRLILTGPSDGPYKARIQIFDHFGVFVRSLAQAFGYCGELENPARTIENGLVMNDLVWNLKNSNGEVVGNGVYLWMVTLHFANGFIKERVFRMGVAKKDPGLYDRCITGF